MGSLSFLSRTDDWLARDEEQAVRSGPAFSDRLKHMSLEQLVEQVEPEAERGAPGSKQVMNAPGRLMEVDEVRRGL